MSLIAFLATFAGAVALAVVFLAVIARLNRLDDDDPAGPPTILIEAPDEPMGDQVDVGAIIRRFGD